MEFVLFLSIFLTSSGYLFKGSVAPAGPPATAPASATTSAPLVGPKNKTTAHNEATAGEASDDALDELTGRMKKRPGKAGCQNHI